MRQCHAKICYLITVGLLVVLAGFSVAHSENMPMQTIVTVNIGIDYGAGTVEWHNNTSVAHGENLLNATKRVAAVEFSSYPGMGAFVTSINGQKQNPAASLYWTFWVYNSQSHQYEMPPVGASAYSLASDQTVQWYYSSGIFGPGTSVSLNARLDTSTDPPTALISGAVRPIPIIPVNVTLAYSQNQGASYQEIISITSRDDGTFTYSWKLVGAGPFMIRAETQGVQSPPISIGASGGIPGFPLESLLAGSLLGLLLLIVRRRQSHPARK
jgi:hypothetical protein